MALTFNPTPPRAEVHSRRTVPDEALDTTPETTPDTVSDTALARQREARAWLARGQAADQEARLFYTRALATDITLREAWEAVAKRWPHQANPIDYRRLAQTLLDEREKKRQEDEALAASDKATLIAIAGSILVLVGALGFVLGAWLS